MHTPNLAFSTLRSSLVPLSCKERNTDSCLRSGLRHLLTKLEVEIGETMDHIEPDDILRGNRRAIANTVEILAAFTSFCLEEGLLEFGSSGGHLNDTDLREYGFYSPEGKW